MGSSVRCLSDILSDWKCGAAALDCKAFVCVCLLLGAGGERCSVASLLALDNHVYTAMDDESSQPRGGGGGGGAGGGVEGVQAKGGVVMQLLIIVDPCAPAA